MEERYRAELKDLYEAIRRDDVGPLEGYVAGGVADDYRAVNFEYPLQTAASHGSNQWLAGLLQAQKDMPRFALQEALAAAVEENHAESVDLLLAAGADAADYPWEEDSEESIPIVQAFAHCNPVVIDALIAAGAISRGDPRWLDEAIEQGLSCRRKSKNECLLTLAEQLTERFEDGSSDSLDPRRVKKLAGRLRKMKASGSRDPKEIAVNLLKLVDEEKAILEEILTEITEGEDDRLELVWRLLSDQPPTRRQRLASAALPYLARCLRSAADAWPLFDAFLEWGADVNSRDDFNATAMIWLGTHAEIRIDVIERLLSLGADINAIDEEGRTVLTWLALRGRKDSDSFGFLRQCGAKTAEELLAE